MGFVRLRREVKELRMEKENLKKRTSVKGPLSRPNGVARLTTQTALKEPRCYIETNIKRNVVLHRKTRCSCAAVVVLGLCQRTHGFSLHVVRQ